MTSYRENKHQRHADLPRKADLVRQLTGMMLFQVKYTNLISSNVFEPALDEGKTYKLLTQMKLASSGSNQAQKGRLVDALAVRGDEGRDTLR